MNIVNNETKILREIFSENNVRRENKKNESI